MTIREKGVTKVDPKAHTVEPTYTGSDIALGITYQVAVGERRSIVIQTHVARDEPDNKLNALFDKITKATDRVVAVYRLQELRKEHDTQTKQFAMSMENYNDTQRRWAADWERRNKRGPFEPSGDQKSIRDNVEKQHQRFRDTLVALEAEIALTEKLVQGK